MKLTGSRGYENFEGHVSEFVSDSVPWWPDSKAARSSAPNIVVMLVDDLGFSDLSPFGSEIPTPNAESIARDGWVFTNYRTTPLCSPSRASLLTGVNPHRVGFGFVAHSDPGFPGFTCELPENAPTLAESLRAGGYATFMVGKWHLTLESRLHDAADKSSWPLQRGFDRYFGSMDGFTSLHHPHRLIRDNSPVDIESFPDGYFLTDELVSESLLMIDGLRANDEAKPFFLYFAHTAVHGPVQAKAADIERHSGRYEEGWNRLREARFNRQVELGIVGPHSILPQGLAADEDRIPDWDTLPAEEQMLFAKHMEVYAAAVESVDDSLGALRSHLEKIGELENTIIILASDNGGTAEGSPSGTRSYFAQFGSAAIDLPSDWVRDVPRDPSDIGGPTLFSHYPTGWARVSNTPFRSFKQSTYEGGVHAPLIVSWPAAPQGEGGLRDQFVFVSDIAPTLLELVKVPRLADINGKKSMSEDGQSFASLFEDPAGKGRDLQYFECVGRRAIVVDNWKAVSAVPPSYEQGASGGQWELYDLTSDPTETNDLSGQNADLVRKLAEQWRQEAWRNAVFPLNDDGSMHYTRPESEKMLAAPVTLAPFRPPLERFRSAQLVTLKSFKVEAEISIGEGAAGVIVSHGDQGGGYLVAIEEGVPLISYNAYGTMHRSRGVRLDPGDYCMQLIVDELPDLRWLLRLEIDGALVADIENAPMLLGMAPFTGISVGYDYGGPVDWELYQQHRSYKFSGGEIVSLRYVPGAKSTYDRTILAQIGKSIADFSD